LVFFLNKTLVWSFISVYYIIEIDVCDLRSFNMDWNKSKIASVLEYSILNPVTLPEEIARNCSEAVKHGISSVFVHPCFVKLAVNELSNSNVKPCSVAGYPFGTNTTEIKAEEARLAVQQGAKEIDMVINIGALKEGDYYTVETDILAVVESVKGVEDKSGTIIKATIETCYLSNNEIIAACKLARDAGANYIKTSTHFGTSGAKTEHIEIIKQTIGDSMKIKASGGIDTLDKAVKMLEAGADCIGTSSALVIMAGFDK
jgi:deoxyribose-phosphate aldolase